jgi:hypothetical protein
VRWDSGQQFIYRIGDEDAYDLRVSSLSTHYFFVLITFCLFRCPASFIQLMFELVANLFYYLSVVLSAPLYFSFKVLDNSTVGVKHPGVECRGCGQKDIAGLRWQCLIVLRLPICVPFASRKEHTINDTPIL